MRNAIEVVSGRTLPARGTAKPAQRKRLTVTWQSGLESGGHVQRKLRLGFANVFAATAANRNSNI